MYLRYEEYLHAHERSYKITNVKPKSLAEKSGFTASNTFVLALLDFKYIDFEEFI